MVSASWSPVNDHVAYCEFGNKLSIVNLKPGEVDPSGIYIADLKTRQLIRLENSPTTTKGLYRSSVADFVLYQEGNQIFVADFDGKIQSIGTGNIPIV